jgi:ferrochelatase
MMVVNRGDQYVAEVAATVAGVMALLRSGGGGGGGAAAGAPAGLPPPPAPPLRNSYVLAWQSKVGFLPWMGPPTGEVLKGLAAQGYKHVLVVPIAFTSDHVETLYEIDVEYAEEAKALGMAQFERAPSLNGEEAFSSALAELVVGHLEGGRAAETPQYALNCPGCVNPTCRSILNPVAPYSKLRDAHGAACKVPVWPSAADVQACRAQGSVPNK